MIIWSLFDGSGLMAQPWAENGHKVVCWNFDDADHGPYNENEARVNHPLIHYANQWIDEVFRDAILTGKAGVPDMIFAFPPCTDLAVSGARHFVVKAERDPQFQEKAVATAKIAAEIAEVFGVPYMIENPVSVLSSKWRKPDHVFEPWEYGGYLPPSDVHPFFPEYIARRDAYPKRTCLWTGNGFVMPGRKPVFVGNGYSTQYHKLGGKSEKTKVVRSLTPRGFARAVFEANRGK